MSGHSKWSSIKHKKKINDEKRSKLFSKLVKNIKVSLKNNNDEQNTKLKTALAKATEKNLNKSIIKKIMLKKNFNSDEKFLYAGISLYNSVFIIECFDDNHNKIISELKHLFLQYSGLMIQYKNIETLFDKFINIKINNFYNECLLLDKLINNNIILYKCIDDKLLINLNNFLKVKDIINFLELNFDYYYEIIPKKFIKLNNNTFLLNLKNKILEKEYVSNVFTNFY